MVAMRDLLGDLYLKTPARTDLRAADIARAYRLHCYMAACQSNCLRYLEKEVTLAVVDAAELAVSLDLVCVDVIDGLNAILKRAYKVHRARGGGGDAGGSGSTTGWGGGLAGLGRVVFKLDLQLRHRGAPHIARYTMAKLIATKNPRPPPSLCNPKLLLRPYMG